MEKMYAYCSTWRPVGGIFRAVILLLFVLAGSTASHAQTQPCSINAGGTFDVCFSADSFQLHGILGSNVDPSTVNWSVSVAGFDIQHIQDPQTWVLPDPNGGDFPQGPVTFTLRAKCFDGSALETTVTVIIEGMPTTPVILANGQNTSAITVCNAVTLTSGAPPVAGETINWYYLTQDDGVMSLTGNVNSNTVVAKVIPNNTQPCRTYTYYCSITNGGCTRLDTIVVTFLSQASDIQFLQPTTTGICTNGHIPLEGSAAGCQHDAWFEVLSTPPGATATITGLGFPLWATVATANVDMPGWYTFVYHVNSVGGICPSGTDTLNVFVCLIPDGVNNTYTSICGIPEHGMLESPQYPGATYEPWTYYGYPTIPNPSPVITPVQPWQATVDIFDFSVDSYTFSQKIIIDTCYYESKDKPGVYIPLVCYVTQTTGFFVQPVLNDTTVNFLCGGVNPFTVHAYFPIYPGGTVSLKVLEAPPGHPNLFAGQTLPGFSNLNLLPTGVYRFQFKVTRYGCSDSGILTVNVVDLEDPACPDVSDFCVNDVVQLVGSIPSNQAAQPLWTQLSGPTLTFLDPVTSTDPRVSSAQSGHVVLEYSFVQSPNCYLADTVEFDILPCDTGCLQITLVDINCFDNDSPNDDDDYWNFIVNISGGGPGSYWVAPAVPEAGAYDVDKTFWMGNILASGSTYTLTVQDYFNPECTATITVQVPEPCSDSCTLHLQPVVGPCNDNGTPYLISDDFYYVTVQVSGVDPGECWIAKSTDFNGGSEILGTFYGSAPVTLGPFLVTDGNWGLWAMLCEMMTCSSDSYITAPEPCSGCHEVTVSNITCFDNNSSNPNDDYWTFDILVNGGPGTFWTATAPVNQSGPYGVVKTIHMGHINQYGSSITFSIYDNTTKACRTDVTIPVPTACSDSCNLDIQTEVSRCNDNGTPYLISDDFYSVTLTVNGVAPGECWMVKRTNPDGSSVVLGTYNSSTAITLGPFLVSEGNWGIWVVLCDTTRYCNDDDYIIAPEPCSGCHKVTISNVTCYDNGTSDPNDDHWSFDILVDGGPGSYWTATAPVGQSGPYGVVKTIYMGAISQYGGTIEFSIFDDKNKECRTDVSIIVPRACSDECKLNVQTKFSECKRIEGETIYYVYLTVTGANGNCWTVKRKLSDGTEIMLGTWSGDQSIILGPFNASEGDWTIWVMACGQFDCVRDLYIRVPCRERSENRLAKPATTFNLFPSPVLEALNIQRKAPADSPMAGEAQFIVLDMLGKTVLQTSMPVAKDYRLLVNELSPGLYYLVVKEQNNVNWTAKFIKR